MKNRSLFSMLLLALSLIGCDAEIGSAALSDGSPDSFVPKQVSCSASCPPGHRFDSLPECKSPSRAADHTLGCVDLVTKCYCSKNRDPLPPILKL